MISSPAEHTISPELNLESVRACPDCDLLIKRHEVPANHTISCPQCGCVLNRNRLNSVEKTLALTLCGLLFFLPAMLLPLISLSKFGLREQANVIDTVVHFFYSGYYLVSFMTMISAIVMPLCLLTLTLVICLHITTGRTTRLTARLFRSYIHLEEWAMTEVYLLGILVTVFKITDIADITYNVGFFSFIILVFITIGIMGMIDRDSFWSRLDTSSPAPEKVEGRTTTPRFRVKGRAAESGLMNCLTCNRLEPVAAGMQQMSTPCPRCGDTLSHRKPASVQRTLALVITSALLFLPANLLPIMDVEFLGVSEPSTIVDGILLFFEEGSYLIGAIILFASVLVPLFKILGLSILLCSSRFKFRGFLKQKTAMYRLITFIGRWSMLDIFVIALLVSLVDFRFFSTIKVAPAATFFCLVVAATMLAANCFDPRLIWDRASNNTTSM